MMASLIFKWFDSARSFLNPPPSKCDIYTVLNSFIIFFSWCINRFFFSVLNSFLKVTLVNRFNDCHVGSFVRFLLVHFQATNDWIRSILFKLAVLMRLERCAFRLNFDRNIHWMGLVINGSVSIKKVTMTSYWARQNQTFHAGQLLPSNNWATPSKDVDNDRKFDSISV